MSFAKALASKYPRGVNVVAEVDFYYPLQTKVAEWYPKDPIHPKIDDNVEQTIPVDTAWTETDSLNRQTFWVIILVEYTHIYMF